MALENFAVSPAASDAEGSGHHARSLSKRRLYIIMVGLNLGMLLTALDFNILAPAVPTIAGEFSEYDNSAWLGTGMLVAFALSLPIYTHLGEFIGRRQVFIIATAIFILGSGLCGGSKSMSNLIWSRVVQGIGAGGIYGLVNIIITDIVPIHEAGRYLASTQMIWAIPDVAGRLLGAAFTRFVTWRWCFWINLILSPLSLLVTVFSLKLQTRKMHKKDILRRFDFVGSILLTGGTVCLLLGVSWGGHSFPWQSSRIIGLLCGGAALIVLFLVIEHFSRHPILEQGVLRSRTVLCMLLAEFFFGANLLGMIYYLPQFFQLVYGDSILLSGIHLIPMMVSLAVGSSLAGEVIKKWQASHWCAVAGAVFATLSCGLLTRWDTRTSRGETIGVLVVLGLGQGAIMTGLLLTAQTAVKPPQIASVTGFCIFVQAVGDVFGIAIYSAVQISRLRSGLARAGLSQSQAAEILKDFHKVKMLPQVTQEQVTQALAEGQQNGWWLLFACATPLLVYTVFGRPRWGRQ